MVLAVTQPRVKFEPEEQAPHHDALPAAVLAISAMVMTTTLIPSLLGRYAGLPEADIEWMLFATLLSAAAIAAVQPLRIGRLGGGLVMLGGASPAFVGVSGLALAHGGLAMLSVLTACSLPVVILFARYAHHLRRVLRPAVMGTVIMLAASSLAQVVLRIATQPPPDGVEPWTNLAAFGVTFGSIVLLTLFSGNRLRYLSPLIGLAAGAAFVWMLGALPAAEADSQSWAGVPEFRVDYAALEFDHVFLVLLPTFLILQIVTSMESYSCSRLAHSLYYRKPKGPDQRSGQGAVLANGAGTLAAALLGSMPTTTYSSTVSVIGLTGIASRRVGFWAALILIVIALSPHMISLIVHFPAPVAAGYLLFIVVLMFNNGIRMATEDGLDIQEGILVFSGFWTGLSLQSGLVGEHLGELGTLLRSTGTAIGGLVTFVLIILLQLRAGETVRLSFLPTPGGFADLHSMVSRFALRLAASPRTVTRLLLGCEEATQLLIAMRQANPAPWIDERIRLSLRVTGRACLVELMTYPSTGDFADMDRRAGGESVSGNLNERLELSSIRILRSLASDIRHTRYHDIDILSFTVALSDAD